MDSVTLLRMTEDISGDRSDATTIDRLVKKQPEKEQTLHIFMELVGYCTIQYGEASVDECIALASFFHTLAEKYFPKVHFQDVGLILEHYALALVVYDSGSYKRWPNPKFSNAHSIRDILTQLESHLQEFNHKNLQTYTEFPAFLCDRIATFILSNYEEMIPVDENSGKLPSIGGYLDRVMEPRLSATCESQSTEHMKQVAKLAVTSFMLLLITKQETKGFLGKLMKDGKIQSAGLTNFCQRLREVYQPLHNSGIVDQAIETLQLCCEASWTRVSSFCEMVKSSEDEVRSNCFLEDRIVDIVNEAAQDSALLLNKIHQHHTQYVDSTFKTSIDRWVLAQEKFQILSPAALVTEWVTIQCQKKRTANLPPTICSLVPSLRNSEQGRCIIIVEELLTYRKMQNFDPQFLELMDNQIQDIIPSISSSEITDRINSLIDGGKLLASRGLKGQLDCITYITEAVNLLLEYKKGDIKVKIGDELFRLLPEAFFLLSLIKRLACPMDKDYTEDIKSGLKLYLENPPSKFSETECTLLSCILDLLSLEANVALQCNVYEIMIKSTGRNLKELLGIALQSGNLHHALCSSHVDDAFLDMVHTHYSLSTTDVLFWRTCVSSKSLEAGTHQSLSMLPTISYLELDDDTRSTKVQETIKEVKCAAQSLIASVSESKNEFAAAHHYYNLAEIMIAKGLMTEVDVLDPSAGQDWCNVIIVSL